jgi:enamine deaminase RidA (YjgF/YER057c/UK114 family)
MPSVTSNLLSFANPAGLYDPRPNGYSHMAVVQHPGRLLLLSGQGGEDIDGALPTDFAGQLRQALHNMQLALADQGANLQHVARLLLLVVDHSEERLAEYTRQIQALYGAHDAPACTLVPVPRLALDGMLVEVEATAVLPAA